MTIFGVYVVLPSYGCRRIPLMNLRSSVVYRRILIDLDNRWLVTIRQLTGINLLPRSPLNAYSERRLKQDLTPRLILVQPILLVFKIFQDFFLDEFFRQKFVV